MKFSGSLKFAALASVAGVLTLALFGCGAAVSNTSFTQGNWAFTASSTAAAIAASSPTFVLGGNLTQSGAVLSGTLTVNNSLCISPQTLSFTGTVKGSDITLTSQAFDGNVISVTASGTKDSLSGNYTITGGCADQGTITANAVPSLSGAWSGTVLVNTSPANMTVTLTQASAASEDGSFALTGSVSYTGSDCEATANLTSSSVKGGSLIINFDSGVNYVPSLNSLTAPTSMAGDYDSTSDQCASNDGIQSVTLAKQ
ncbi:MAG TPA: hypothetical protein VNW47_07465 [Terriglobales bacterium]|jgi:hypothetical protein|nr:hypothetical protein [Terriglobales bacterium]